MWHRLLRTSAASVQTSFCEGGNEKFSVGVIYEHISSATDPLHVSVHAGVLTQRSLFSWNLLKGQRFQHFELMSHNEVLNINNKMCYYYNFQIFRNCKTIRSKQ